MVTTQPTKEERIMEDTTANPPEPEEDSCLSSLEADTILWATDLFLSIKLYLNAAPPVG